MNMEPIEKDEEETNEESYNKKMKKKNPSTLHDFHLSAFR